MSPRSHESWKEQLPAYLLGALSPGEKTDLEYHLGGCAECQAELRWLEPAKEKLVEQVRQVEPSSRLKTNLMAAVAEDLRENPVDESSSVPATAEPVADRGSVAKRRKTSRFGWLDFGQLLRPATIGSLAVVLFVGVIAGYAITANDDDGSAPTTVAKRVIPETSVVGRADALLVATGDSGTLTINNLKKLDDDEVYQAWIQKGDAIEPTASLFTPNRDGTATTSIPNLHDVDVVMVSAEPKGGSPQPTSAPIITINIPS